MCTRTLFYTRKKSTVDIDHCWKSLHWENSFAKSATLKVMYLFNFSARERSIWWRFCYSIFCLIFVWFLEGSNLLLKWYYWLGIAVDIQQQETTDKPKSRREQKTISWISTQVQLYVLWGRHEMAYYSLWGDVMVLFSIDPRLSFMVTSSFSGINILVLM